jgi:hypothetical protein
MQRSIHGSGPDDATEAHPHIAARLHAPGNVCWRKGAYAAAREFYTRSLAMERSIHGSGPDDATAAHPHIAATLAMLGVVAFHQGALSGRCSTHAMRWRRSALFTAAVRMT